MGLAIPAMLAQRGRQKSFIMKNKYIVYIHDNLSAWKS